MKVIFNFRLQDKRLFKPLVCKVGLILCLLITSCSKKFIKCCFVRDAQPHIDYLIEIRDKSKGIDFKLIFLVEEGVELNKDYVIDIENQTYSPSDQCDLDYYEVTFDGVKHYSSNYRRENYVLKNELTTKGKLKMKITLTPLIADKEKKVIQYKMSLNLTDEETNKTLKYINTYIFNSKNENCYVNGDNGLWVKMDRSCY